ncbi:Threonine/homoserine/homoserine lactone efflux protein [Marisediminitalea aggregata]|jgi:threonine/homoserine/homoserine lactone efflux protein|uniref:Threonine/homoserine/homoserine lactone efflux protein n=1 Tax=Marisediminitalea aggregata TaxID=634436 RepID=A0A1M5E5E0_9ALTE|nr:LysE family translocator [Marisediminitalea aggregata]MAH55832.1 LysE family translocator [Aestuariibacter sp.]MAP20592.1 LysE family translocator [Alteromonadaceae bacterium]MEC7469702.1 LysE family translocator [Pseudomonadota bacterium]BBO29387.1 lysine transporter LysE [Alteromonas sp. I4]HBY39752.1 LysE family translocator [Alteromonas sp.]|tara:strand:- start:970 stop:1599 length:630 start_codon:yes stop_codon:yes gene_type:complete
MDATNLWAFVLSCLLLNILPGPDSLYIIARAASQGAKAGIVATLGIISGVSVHILGAAVGLGALLATSAWAFTAVKLAGCLYLFYLGISLLIAKREKETEQKPHIKPASLRRIYTGGVLTNVLNPKVALFFLAFVPQFIPADVVNKTQAFITLGGVFVFTGTLWCIFLALATAFMRNKLGGVKGLGFWLNKAAGGLFVYFGVKLGLASA